MSYFSVALHREAEHRQINQSEIARRSGLSRSFVSRLVTGEARELSDDTLLALLAVFSADPAAQSQLLAARCMDVREVARSAKLPAADLVDISVRSGGRPEQGGGDMPQVHLSSETEKAFAWLRSQCPLNPDLEQHLVGYARLTGMK